MKGIFGALEMLCVGALMLLFGLMTYTLVAVGGGTFERILDKREATSDLRQALSYVSMQVRKSDTAGGARLVTADGGQYLALRRDYGSVTLERRIYFWDGVLYDTIGYPEEPFQPQYGNEILELEDFSFAWDGVLLTVTAVQNGMSRSVGLTLRSEAAA